MSKPGASPRRRKAALTLSIGSNLALLGFFKYFMFLETNVNALLEVAGLETFDMLAVTLPIGISFYTFQTMSYSIDIYRGAAKPVGRFSDFSLFVALFPQLVAGPIVRYHTIADQLAVREHSASRFASGASLFILGFGKKILLANPMGTIADAVFALEHAPVGAAWWGALAYAFQIYFDFSAYSDMAVGIGRMFGLEIPRNFNSPYHASSISEFWRRWHMSLSTWFRDYLFLPIAYRTARRLTRLTENHRQVDLWGYVITTMTVMFLVGLWHGASWSFVAWGVYHGALMAAERFFLKRRIYKAVPHLVRVAGTSLLVLLSWVIFRATDLDAAITYFGCMFGLLTASASERLVNAEIFAGHNLGMMSICFAFVCFKTQAWDFAEKVTWPKVLLLSGLMLVACLAMFTQAFNPFLYFQF
jgi:alginate O-acetyltransferase complex protein AlgI